MGCLSCIETVRFSIFCNFKKNISIDLTYESRFQNNEVIIKQRPGFLIRLFKHFCQFFCHLFSVLGNPRYSMKPVELLIFFFIVLWVVNYTVLIICGYPL